MTGLTSASGGPRQLWKGGSSGNPARMLQEAAPRHASGEGFTARLWD